MIKWTAEELAEMAAADAEIEDGFRESDSEILAADRRDKSAREASAGVDREKASRHRYYLEHKEHCQAYKRAYCEKNREQIRERQARWYWANREHILAQQHVYRQAIREDPARREKERQKSRAYYWKNREKILAKARAKREAEYEKA